MKMCIVKSAIRVACIMLVLSIFSSALFAQKLKSSPQGNQFLKLNGTFRIDADPASRRQSAALSMILADLDGDGLQDLVTGRDNGISVQMGDLNAFAPQTREAWEAIRDLRFLSPFKSDSKTLELPVRAEMMVAGDFDRDSFVDIVAASRDGNAIFLLRGDGQGGISSISKVETAGSITSLVTGDVNRLDGLPDIVAGIDTGGVSSLAIYAGFGNIFKAAPEYAELAAPATHIIIGQFDENSFGDIAVASGGEVIIFPGRDKNSDEPQPVRIGQGIGIIGMAAGDFIPDRDYRAEISVLGADGFIRIFSRGDLDTRPVTKKELIGVEAFEKLQKGMPIPERIMKQIAPGDLKEKPESSSRDAAVWDEADIFFAGSVPSEPIAQANLLSSARLSNRAGDDLVLMDTAGKNLLVFPLAIDGDPKEGVRFSYAGKRVSVKFDLDGAPVSVAAARLNFDGEKDLIILEEGALSPATLMSAPEASFTVNSNGDAPDANPGNGVCATAGAVCTLRAAIMEANHLNGADSITINSGIGTITLNAGTPDNDSAGTNSESSGDLDISCTLTPGQDCVFPLSTNVSGLTITGAVGNSVVSGGTYAVAPGGTSTTDRIFDVGMDGIFGGGFGGSVQVNVTMSNMTIQNGNVREEASLGGNIARGGAFRYDGFGQSGTRGTLSLTNVTINGNQADHDTGGIFDQFASVSITTSTISNNIGKAGPGGGMAFLASTPATLSVSSSTFSGNEARTGMVFMSTATDVDGGAFTAGLDNNTATITNTNFTNNISHDDGGAVRFFGGAATVTGGTMSGNTARDDGGAVWGDNDTVSAGRFLTLSGVTIQGNTANSDSTGGGDGGAIFRDRGTLNVNTCTIGGMLAMQPNNAANGGGIAHAFRAAVTPSNVAAVNIDGGTITANNAATDGGGVYINAANQAVGNPSVLSVGPTTTVGVTENNSNVHGGGFAISGNATANISRATIHGNDADKDTNNTGDGGGIYHNNASGILTITGGSVVVGQSGQGNTAAHGGGLHVSNGTANVNGVTFAANTSLNGTEVRLTGGTTNFSGTVTIPGELSIAGGTLAAGSSTVNLGEDFHFTSGTFTAGTSTFNFNGSGAQQIYGGSVPTFNNLTDSNTVQQLNVVNNANANGNLTINANAVLNPSATVIIGGSGTLTGNGTARVTRTAATADFLSQYTITNKTLSNLLVDYVGSAAQTVSATTYGGLRLNSASGASLAAGTTTIGGTLTLQSGNLGIGTSTLVLNAGTSVSGGTFSSSATGTVNYNQGSNTQSVLAGSYGNLTFSNFNKTLPGGTVNVAGTFTPGSATGHTIAGNTFSFNGAGAQTIPSFTYNHLTTATGGVKTTGTTVNVNGNATVGSGTTLSVPGGSTLTVTGTLTNNNIIQGNGTIANNFSNGGTLSPGLSPGILSITGNFVNAGIFNVEIGGTGGAGVNPNGHDQLIVSGTATLGGTLTVTLTNGFTPVPGNSFLIIDAATSSGNFTTVNLPNIFPNVWRSLRDDAAGTYTLNVVGPTAAAVSVGGRALTSGGQGISRVVISMTDEDGNSRTAMTNQFGYYKFENVGAGQTVVLAAFSKGHTFSPPTQVVFVSEDLSQVNFISAPELWSGLCQGRVLTEGSLIKSVWFGKTDCDREEY